MNHSIAFAKPTVHGYVGVFRLYWRTEAFPVREHRDGPVLYFNTPEKAEVAAWRVKHKIEERIMLRSGEIAGGTKSAAEALFRPKDQRE